MAQAIEVTVNYGADSITQNFLEPVTVDRVLNDPTIRGALSYGQNVVLQDADGVVLDGAEVLEDGADVYVVKKAASKA